MREIKFKGWDGKNMLDAQDLSINIDYWEWLGSVDVKLLQYTGFKDKNGKEIYEGDIMTYENPHFEYTKEELEEDPLYIYYNSVCGYYAWKDKSGEKGLFEEIDAEDCRIIGNIHQNPELLLNVFTNE